MEAHIAVVLFFFSESSSHKQTYSRKKLTWNLEFLLRFQVLGISSSIGSTFYCSCSVSGGVDVGFRCACSCIFVRDLPTVMIMKIKIHCRVCDECPQNGPRSFFFKSLTSQIFKARLKQ